MKPRNLMTMGLLVASTLTLSGCWMVRGDHGRGGHRQQDSIHRHDNRHDPRNQRDQRGQRHRDDRGNMTPGQPPRM